VQNLNVIYNANTYNYVKIIIIYRQKGQKKTISKKKIWFIIKNFI
jgi:hypothetical protein